MQQKDCIAMILAGGRGERLGSLTQYYSKPAIHFGGKNRIIDFTLSNCKNSGIDTVGVLSQYFTTDIDGYLHSVYGDKPEDVGIHLLASKSNDDPYIGTADAVCRNLAFIDQFSPEYVLVLASDHVYKMDYRKLIVFHEEKGADVTVASMPVSMEKAAEFGILNAEKNGRVLGFDERPSHPKSNLASIGVYVFRWSSLKKYLLKDSKCKQSQHDFGRDILPEMLCNSQFYTYQFNGYWCDVGTVDKLWEANMVQLDFPSMLHLSDDERDIRISCTNRCPSFISDSAVIHQSMISRGCTIFGNIVHSVLSDSVTVEQGAEVVNSVVMPNAYIGPNVKLYDVVVGANAVIMDNTTIGSDHGMNFFVDRQVCTGGVSLVAPWTYILESMDIKKNSQISKQKLDAFYLSSPERLDLRHNAVNRVSVSHAPVHAALIKAAGKTTGKTAKSARNIPTGNVSPHVPRKDISAPTSSHFGSL